MKFYSKQDNAFFDDGIHTSIPSDAVELSDEQYDDLIVRLSDGKILSGDEAGNPILLDPPPPTEQELREAQNARARRYLASTDWYVVRFSETGEPIPEDVKQKRAEARAAVVE